MNKKIIISSILLGYMFFGCKPPAPKTELALGDCPPTDLQVDVNDQSMHVSWVNDCEQTIAGYNIYISKENNSNGPYNNAPFDGDTDPTDGVENFTAEKLENGKRYYVSVAIVNPDQTESKRSQEILAVCGPREEIELSIRYKSDNDGYSLDQNQYVRADSDKNDFYFFSKNGIDYLNSPENLGGFLKETDFAILDYKGDFDELRNKIYMHRRVATDNKVAVSKNDWILLQTDNNMHALINVLGFSGSGEERKIKLFVAYAPIKADLIF